MPASPAPKTRALAVLIGAGLCATALTAGLKSGGADAPVAPPARAQKPAPAEPPLPANARRYDHGRFRNFVVYTPAGTPTSFVLFLSGADGWNRRVGDMAQRLVDAGAMVAGIDLPSFEAALEADGAECVFPDGDLENLSHFAQAYYRLPTYLPPILAGYSAGAALAFAVLAQAPKDTFGAALSLGFCPSLGLRKPLCAGSGLQSVRRGDGRGVDLLPPARLGNPWVLLQGESTQACPLGAAREFAAKVRGSALVALPVGPDFTPASAWVPQFKAAFGQLVVRQAVKPLAPAPAALGDLPVVEIPAPPGAPPSDTFAIMLSGDGGWAGLDQQVAAALAARGIPVVGLDSLRYFWTARTPEGLAADTDRLIRYYLAHLDKQRVLLLGYSQGADVLPFAVNRLPAATRARVALTAIMGMSEHALFEFHLSSWLSDGDAGRATLPEVERITGVKLVCIYGADENDSLCPRLDSKKFIVVEQRGGHHFDGDYAGLARIILAALKQ